MTPAPVRWRRCSPALRLGLGLACLHPAHAQTAGQAGATELFERGREQLRRGQLDQACTSFDASQRLDPKVGTLLNAGLCEETRGRPLAARQRYQRALDLAESLGDPRSPTARERLAAIEPRVPRLTVYAVGLPAGARIERDGGLLDGDSLGVPLRVEVGEHELVLTVSGREPRRATVSLAEGETRVFRWTLDAEPAAEAAPPVASGRAAVPVPPRSRVPGYAALAISGVSLGLGGYFGWRALDRKNASNDGHCDASVRCDDVGLRLRDEARQAGTVSTVAVSVGLVSAAVGLYLLWVRRPATIVAWTPTRPASVALGFTF